MDLSGITPTGVASGGLPVTSQGSTHCVLSHLELLHSLSGDLPVPSTHPSPSHLWSHVVGRLLLCLVSFPYWTGLGMRLMLIPWHINSWGWTLNIWNQNGPAMEFDYCCPIAVLSVIGNVSVLCVKLVILKEQHCLLSFLLLAEWFLEHQACIVLIFTIIVVATPLQVFFHYCWNVFTGSLLCISDTQLIMTGRWNF